MLGGGVTLDRSRTPQFVARARNAKSSLRDLAAGNALSMACAFSTHMRLAS